MKQSNVSDKGSNKILGVTGGIGSGKSTVVSILKDLDTKVIDADIIAKEVVQKGSEALKEISESFGKSVIDDNGELKRSSLGEIVFNDKEKLNALNNITHKYIAQRIFDEINNIRKTDKDAVIVLDVPIPIEQGFLDVSDEIWVVSCDRETRIHRIMERNSLSYEKALARINSQLSDDEYKKIGDKVIVNENGIEELKEKVYKNYKIFLNRIK